MSEPGHPVFTVGHSTHALEAFVALLNPHRVTVLGDVRSSPFSRFNPHFNKEALERSMKKYGIKYVFLGRELGARPDDPSCYVKGRVQYSWLARTDRFLSGLKRVASGSENHRIALMCAEKEPLECHRTLLVARALDDLGVPVQHILVDGRLESHGDAVLRLLDLVGVPHEDLFRSKKELVAEALARQEARVAFVDENLAAESAREGQ